MRAEYSPQAERDLEAAVDNFLRVSQRAALEFADLVDETVASIERFPEMGVARPAGRRSIVLGRSSYRLIYEVRSDTVRVLRLQNMRRRRT